MTWWKPEIAIQVFLPDSCLLSLQDRKKDDPSACGAGQLRLGVPLSAAAPVLLGWLLSESSKDGVQEGRCA